MTSRIRFVVETVEDCGKTVHGSFTGLINSMASLSRRCRAFRTVARHPHRHTVDHGTLVAGSQVPGLSPTFSGKRPLLQNFPSRKERKVVSFLEGKLSPTNAKDEKRRGKVGAQVGRPQTYFSKNPRSSRGARWEYSTVADTTSHMTSCDSARE